MNRNKTYKNLIAIILAVFALITIFMSSSVLFDWFGIRASQGNYVPFILKINLTVGIIYLAVVYGYIKSQSWAFWAMVFAALLLIYAFSLLYLHIHTGGLYENRTLGVMTFRVLFTLVFAGLIYGSANKTT